MTIYDPIAGLLSDLDTLTTVARAGVISRRELRLEPGETRPAAIVYIDVVGFTDLSRVLTSEQLTRLIDRVFRIFELTANSQGGYCDKVIGDAALFVFPGHPNYAPACEAALRAAVLMAERTARITQSLSPTGLSLSIRTGVSFGEVTRQRVGGEKHQLTVMGETVNIAQRLEGSAEPSTVQTTVRVLEQAGDQFEVEKRGSIWLKGFNEVAVFRVLGLRPTAVQLRGAYRRLTPLVGRDEVLAEAETQVRDWLGSYFEPQFEGLEDIQTDAGPNRLLLIRGAQAVGKSRLAYELIQRLATGGRFTLPVEELAESGAETGEEPAMAINTATGQCTELSSLLTFAGRLAHVAGLDAGNLPQRWQELCDYAEAAVGEDYADRQREHLPLLAVLLDCPDVDTNEVRMADPRSFLLGVMAALRSCCELAALYTAKPVVLVVEDVQWLGDLREVLEDLLEHTRLAQPLVIVATARSPFATEPGGLKEGRQLAIDLPPLTMEDGLAIVQALLPGVHLSADITHELHEKAIGLPYYYEEFARMLLRRGFVVPAEETTAGTEPEHYELAQELTGLEMPEDIRMLILGHLDQLDPTLRDLTGRASVLGRTFAKELLEKIEAKLGTTTPAQLERGLDALVDQQILEEEPGGLYYFQHVMTRDAAYDALLGANRALLHGVTADVLGEMLVPGSSSEAVILPELTLHLEAAGRARETHERCCQLLSLKAHTGRFENWDNWERLARSTWEEARDGDPGLAPESFLLLRAQGIRQLTQGNPTQARAFHIRALSLARRTGQRRIEGYLLNDLGNLYHVQRRVDQAWGCYLNALRISRELDLRRLEGIVLHSLGVVCREQGELKKALDYYMQALKKVRASGDRRNEALIFDSLGLMYLDKRMSDLSEDSFTRALLIAREIRNRWNEGMTLGNLGLLQMRLLKMKESKTSLDQALEIAQEVGDPRLEGEIRERRSILLLRTGEPDAARADLLEAERLLASVGDPFQLAFVHCQWAFYHLAKADAAAARVSLGRAEQIATELSVKPQSALTWEMTKVHLALRRQAGNEDNGKERKARTAPT